MKKVCFWATLACSLALLTATSAFAQAPARPAGTSVAVVDINFIFKNHARFNQKMEEIKGEIENFERYLRDEREKITAKTEELQKIPAGSPQYKQLEESIAAMHTTLSLETGRKRKEILENEATTLTVRSKIKSRSSRTSMESDWCSDSTAKRWM